MHSGASAVASLRSKRYQILKTDASTQSRVHPTITARQNQVNTKYHFELPPCW
ncbi:unnamed protein product [Thelazia callipaeda]|uniref:Uncharacterized protein n=1 Tax=Thelazia callipaeda TaxID=103827 RepID=A0A0N5CM12_THECL|nr:unnamed protein product [Thelazia callipaeda]